MIIPFLSNLADTWYCCPGSDLISLETPGKDLGENPAPNKLARKVPQFRQRYGLLDSAYATAVATPVSQDPVTDDGRPQVLDHEDTFAEEEEAQRAFEQIP